MRDFNERPRRRHAPHAVHPGPWHGEAAAHHLRTVGANTGCLHPPRSPAGRSGSSAGSRGSGTTGWAAQRRSAAGPPACGTRGGPGGAGLICAGAAMHGLARQAQTNQCLPLRQRLSRRLARRQRRRLQLHRHRAAPRGGTAAAAGVRRLLLGADRSICGAGERSGAEQPRRCLLGGCTHGARRPPPSSRSHRGAASPPARALIDTLHRPAALPVCFSNSSRASDTVRSEGRPASSAGAEGATVRPGGGGGGERWRRRRRFAGLPAGHWRLRAGLHAPASGERHTDGRRLRRRPRPPDSSMVGRYSAGRMQGAWEARGMRVCVEPRHTREGARAAAAAMRCRAA